MWQLSRGCVGISCTGIGISKIPTELRYCHQSYCCYCQRLHLASSNKLGKEKPTVGIAPTVTGNRKVSETQLRLLVQYQFDGRGAGGSIKMCCRELQVRGVAIVKIPMPCNNASIYNTAIIGELHRGCITTACKMKNRQTGFVVMRTNRVVVSFV